MKTEPLSKGDGGSVLHTRATGETFLPVTRASVRHLASTRDATLASGNGVARRANELFTNRFRAAEKSSYATTADP
jgi:hypothetical protein